MMSDEVKTDKVVTSQILFNPSMQLYIYHNISTKLVSDTNQNYGAHNNLSSWTMKQNSKTKIFQYSKKKILILLHAEKEKVKTCSQQLISSISYSI